MASPQNSVSLFKQSDNTVIAGSESVPRNNGGLESTADWNNNITTPVVKSETSSTASRINVETLLHTNETHQLKKGVLVQDSLPGIINKFG